MNSVVRLLLNGRWTQPFGGTPASKPLDREVNTDSQMFGENTHRAVFPYKGGGERTKWVCGYLQASDCIECGEGCGGT